ncbi:uncharacterized protein LOC141912449 [Tubulanus polymorphus]|uniref:uncharacterized protein LOC141912449 n=1 Tax=Tubulanus polymorphus TaxID=672921 RepID=UPI003DA21228
MAATVYYEWHESNLHIVNELVTHLNSTRPSIMQGVLGGTGGGTTSEKSAELPKKSFVAAGSISSRPNNKRKRASVVNETDADDLLTGDDEKSKRVGSDYDEAGEPMEISSSAVKEEQEVFITCTIPPPVMNDVSTPEFIQNASTSSPELQRGEGGDDVCDILKLQIAKMRDLLSHEPVSVQREEIHCSLAYIQSLSADEIAEFYAGIQSTVNAENVQILTDCFISMETVVSHLNCLKFLKMIVYSQLIGLKQNVSRSLLATVQVMTRKYHSASVAGIFIPLATSIHSSSPQIDLVAKIVKDEFTVDQKLEFFRLILVKKEPWQESIMILLQNLLDARLPLDAVAVSSLCTCIENSSISLANKLKFGKLMLSTINAYGSQN